MIMIRKCHCEACARSTRTQPNRECDHIIKNMRAEIVLLFELIFACMHSQQQGITTQ